MFDDQERALCLAKAKGRVKLIRSLLEDIGLNIFARVLVDKYNANIPLSHGIALDSGVLTSTTVNGSGSACDSG